MLVWSSLAIPGEIHNAVRDGDAAKVKVLLKSDPNLVHSRDSNGRTPLHLAAQEGNKGIAELLLTSKADINAKDNNGWTPLQMATTYARKDVEELLSANKAVAADEPTARNTTTDQAAEQHARGQKINEAPALTFANRLRAKRAKAEFVAWIDQNKIASPAQAWAKLKHPSWMLDLADMMDVTLDAHKLRSFACDCAEKVLVCFENQHPTDKRPRLAIETARRFAQGKATKEELAVAMDAVKATSKEPFTGDNGKYSHADDASSSAAESAFFAADVFDVDPRNPAAAYNVGAAYNAASDAREAASAAAAFLKENWHSADSNAAAAVVAGQAANESAASWQADRLRFYFPLLFSDKG
ncbi:MAG: ankyrin repeat domain-containing protein [Syntrophorhabdales bacterium]|jgi:hypothetical protein